MISEDNIKMGNKALEDEMSDVESRASQTAARLKETVNQNLRRASSQALAVRDKVYDNPKMAAGIALAAIAGVWAISRSVSANRRRQRTVTKLLAAAGLWRALTPLWKAARKKAPRVQKAGMKQLNHLGEVLQDNAGPLLTKYLPKAIKRFSH
jgi:hypothetical protein